MIIKNLATILMLKNENRYIHGIEEEQPSYTMLEQQLNFLKFSEKIYILDDHSEDASLEIYKKFPNTMVIPKPFDYFDENKSLNILLDAARENEHMWVLYLDGDEILEDSAIEWIDNITKNKNPIDRITIRFNYINLWRSRKKYRKDNFYNAEAGKIFSLHNDLISWGTAFNNHHFAYDIPNNFGDIIQSNKKILHYAWVNWNNMIKKCERYIQLEMQHNKTSLKAASQMYEATLNERKIILLDCEPQWNEEFR